jgi:hypothetical protein
MADLVYAALVFAAGVLAGKWLEKRKGGQSGAPPPAQEQGRAGIDARRIIEE